MKRSFFRYLVLIAITSCVFGCGNVKKETDQQTSIQTVSTPKELQELNEKILKDSTNATLYYTRSKYYITVRDFIAAELDLSRVMKLDSMKPEYYITLSDIYLYGNHTSKSKSSLEKCLSLDPKNTDAMLKLAELYFYVKKYEESIKYINDALKVNTYLSKAYFLKGMNFKELGDTAKAISSMVTATEQDPEYYTAYVEIASLYAAKKNDLAISYFDNALRIDPKSTEALCAKGEFFQDVKEYDNAIKTYNAVLKLDPKYKYAHYNLGAIDLINKKYDTAIIHFTDAISSDGKYAQAYYARATCYLQKNDNAKAKLDYQLAAEADPAFQPAKDALQAIGK